MKINGYSFKVISWLHIYLHLLDPPLQTTIQFHDHAMQNLVLLKDLEIFKTMKIKIKRGAQ
jgi:hypothetical protein